MKISMVSLVALSAKVCFSGKKNDDVMIEDEHK